MLIAAGLAFFCACSSGSSSDDDIKTPGEDCTEESEAGDVWCFGDKNACVDSTCRLPCTAASDCTALLNHVCCEVDDAEAADMVCLPEAVAGASQCL
jgi:hypothetical protein